MPRLGTWILMLLAWGCTWLLIVAGCLGLQSYSGALIAAEGALVAFGLAAVTGVGSVALAGLHLLVERRLRSAGTAWTPPTF